MEQREARRKSVIKVVPQIEQIIEMPLHFSYTELATNLPQADEEMESMKQK